MSYELPEHVNKYIEESINNTFIEAFRIGKMKDLSSADNRALRFYYVDLEASSIKNYITTTIQYSKPKEEHDKVILVKLIEGAINKQISMDEFIKTVNELWGKIENQEEEVVKNGR